MEKQVGRSSDAVLLISRSARRLKIFRKQRPLEQNQKKKCLDQENEPLDPDEGIPRTSAGTNQTDILGKAFNGDELMEKRSSRRIQKEEALERGGKRSEGRGIWKHCAASMSQKTVEGYRKTGDPRGTRN